ncbi:unnamed protein product [marine sediment metagenome]|uniref:Uncharacterized protein n=1 Tax=marine sediment metagenome TaxID=412755 RepID=X0U2E2_9ZZZZ
MCCYLFRFAYHFIFGIKEDNSKNVKKINNKQLYQVYFKIRGKEYKFAFKPSRLPNNISTIVGVNKENTENEILYDITEEAMPYLNYTNDCIKQELCEIYDEYDYIVIEKTSGEIIKKSYTDK